MTLGHQESASLTEDRRLARHLRVFRGAAGRLIAVSLCASLLNGCVRRGEYDAAVADLQGARDEAHAMSLEAERLRVEARRLEGEAQKAGADKQALEIKDAELSRNFEDLALMNTELTNRLRGAGQSVEQLAQERGSLEQALVTTRAQLAEWRKQQTALTARSGQQRQLAAALRQPLDAHTLELGVRGGYVMLTLPSDPLFEPGSVSIKAAGRPTLLQAAQALRGLSGRRFRIAAHVDATRPVSGKPPAFSTNWQLTTSRALAITRELVQAGVPPAALSSSASAEYDPVDGDDTPAGRARSRRIEIVLEPLPDEMAKPKP